MNVIISAIILTCLLFCGAEGQEAHSCIKDTGASFCGCHLKDSANHTIMNIMLGFVGEKTVRHDVFGQFTYSPCSPNGNCGDGKAAVCRHIEGDPFSHKSIGLLNNVSYSVKPQGVAATYMGPNGDDTSVVYLVCAEDDKNNGSFTFLRHDGTTYVFQLSYYNFCVPQVSSTTVVTSTTMNSNTSTPTMTTTVTTTTSTPTKTSSPITTSTSTKTSSPITTSTSTKTSSPITTSTSTKTSSPITTSTSTETSSPITTSTSTKTSSPITTSTSTKTSSPITTSTSTKTSSPITTSTPTKTSSSSKVTSTSTSPTPSSSPSKGHSDTVAVAVGSSIGGVVIIIVIVVAIIYCLKKRKQDQYERLPEM